jgi:hypothetical protein
MKKSLLILTVIALFAVSCSKPEEETGPKLIFKFRFDSTQTRLDNFGQHVASIEVQEIGDNRRYFSLCRAHYIELASDSIITIRFWKYIVQSSRSWRRSEAMAIDFSKVSICWQ